MGKSRTSAAVKNRWNKANYDQILFFVPKGEKDEIKAAAKSAGLSVNAFVAKAVHALMDSAEISHDIPEGE